MAETQDHPKQIAIGMGNGKILCDGYFMESKWWQIPVVSDPGVWPAKYEYPTIHQEPGLLWCDCGHAHTGDIASSYDPNTYNQTWTLTSP